MSDVAVEVSGLTKSYGPLQAVRGIDLRVDKGEVFALLGPNGAGKTTTVEILEGHRPRSGGEVRVLGFDPARGERAFKERIGVVLQSKSIEPYLTVEEAVEMYRGYYPHPLPLDEVIRLVGLEDKRKQRVKRLSGGQQRRLDVAIGLAGDPDLLFLDEPTTGFDPAARRNAWNMVRNLSELGKTVFLTTHYMDEAQQLADHVAIIVDGKIVAGGPPSTLTRGSTPTTTIAFRLPGGASLPPELEARAHIRDGRVELESANPTKTLNELTGWALDNGIEVDAWSVSRPSLEDVYLELTKAAEEEAR